MDKEQAIHDFWSGFGLTAYDSNTVPDGAQTPYITYDVSIDNIGNPVLLTGSIWYRSTSWEAITKKKDEIAEAIGYGHKIIKVDGGYIYITRGSPFAQRMSNEDDSIRRIYINLMAEFLTAY